MKKLFFNDDRQVEIPILILEAKSGAVYGSIDGVTGLKYTRNLIRPNEISFTVAKYLNGNLNPLWKEITDLKTVHIPEYNEKFQIKVTYNDEETETKSVTGTALAEAELSQILLRNFECNTDTDLELHNYQVTRFYDEEHTELSLLHRVFNKAPHYKIVHVDDTLKNLSYEYSANEKSIYDFLSGDVAEQMQCLFMFDSVTRELRVYDLCSTCQNPDCVEETLPKRYDTNGQEIRTPYRDDFHGECPKCHSSNVTGGYGNDTAILIDRENLARSIVTETETDSLKNCLYVEGGDENINAAFLLLNPCGGQYLYYFSPAALAEMPEEFQTAYHDYTAAYNGYCNENVIDSTKTTHECTEPLTAAVSSGSMYERPFDSNKPDSNYIEKFNAVADHISKLSEDTAYSRYAAYKSETSFTGQAALVTAYYHSTDLQAFLQTSMQPSYERERYNKYQALALLTGKHIGTVAIAGYRSETTPKATIQRAILKCAKTLLDTSLYHLDIAGLDPDAAVGTYRVIFSVTDLQEENGRQNNITNQTFRHVAEEEGYSDNSVLNTIPPYVSIQVNDDVEVYCKNKITDIIAKSKLPEDNGLYEWDETRLSDSEFEESINLYSMDNLTAINDVMQSCLDVLSSEISTTDNEVSLHLEDYKKTYLKRQQILQRRITFLSHSISDVRRYGLLMLAYIEEIQKKLNFKDFLTNYPSSQNLWDLFSRYRREGTYKNEHIISEGLDDKDIVTHAAYLMEFAKKEAVRAGTPQITVTNSLNNLLSLPEFESILDHFEVGNWIKIRTNIDESSGNDTIYNLRLLSYTICFDDIPNIDVEFSTVTDTPGGLRDVSDVLESARSMTSSFNYISRQADKASSAASIVDTWVRDSLDLTSQKITSQANDQSIVMDSHGILARKYDDLSDTYDDCQLKIFNNGVYYTNDNWAGIKTGIGKFKYLDPKNNFAETEGYGVIAEKLVSDIILSSELGIYNSNGSMCFREDGLIISGQKRNGAKNIFTVNPNDDQKLLKISKEYTDCGIAKTDDIFYTDSSGNLHMVGVMDINGGYFRGDIQAEGVITGGKIAGAAIEGGSLSVGGGKLLADNTQCRIHGDITAESLTINDRISVSGKGEILDCGRNGFTQLYLKLGLLPKTYIQLLDNGVTDGNSGQSGKISLCSASVEIPGSLTVNQEISGALNGCAARLASSGNVSAPMTFHWQGQQGQPSWVWGGNSGDGDAGNMYVWNPANFSVNYAATAGKAKTAESAQTADTVYKTIKSTETSSGNRYHAILTNAGNFRPDEMDFPESMTVTTVQADGSTRQKDISLHSAMNLGTGSYRWNTLYISSGAIQTSDRSRKQNIQPLSEKHLQLFLLLQPVSFCFHEGTSGRTHIGFISQDVEAAMKKAGLTDLDFAGFCKDVKTAIRRHADGSETEEPVLDADGNPEYIYSLRYEEFIAINTYALQRLTAELNTVRSELSALKESVGNLIKFTNYKEEPT